MAATTTLAMNRNALIRNCARLLPHPRLKRTLAALLSPSVAVQSGISGKYEFAVDLSQGSLQKELYLAPDSYEIATQRIIARLLEPGMTVMDVGANVGFFSVLMADAVGKTGRVSAFEPYEPHYRMLKRNLETNSLDWAEAFCLALSDRAGSATLSLNPINDGGHSLGDFTRNPAVRWDSSKFAATVQTDTIDAFLDARGVRSVDLIKIDVEGAETLVFSGASRLLAAPDAPILICEVGDEAQMQFGKTERELREQLYSFGYRSYFIEPDVAEFGIETRVEGLPNILFSKEDAATRLSSTVPPRPRANYPGA